MTDISPQEKECCRPGICYPCCKRENVNTLVMKHTQQRSVLYCTEVSGTQKSFHLPGEGEEHPENHSGSCPVERTQAN